FGWWGSGGWDAGEEIVLFDCEPPMLLSPYRKNGCRFSPAATCQGVGAEGGGQSRFSVRDQPVRNVTIRSRTDDRESHDKVSHDYIQEVSRHLMGAGEIARRLGLSRQRIQQLAERDDWPAPYDELAMGRVWLIADIEDWIRRQRVEQQPAPDATAATGDDQPDG
ncbi:helix-turn-helix transcriptional regulator, partial [Actinoplanes palleronii]